MKHPFLILAEQSFMALAVGIVSWSSVISATASFATCSTSGRAGTAAAKDRQDFPLNPP